VPPSPSPRSVDLDIVEVRRLWPNVLDKVRDTKKVTWLMLFEKVTVASVDAERLVVAFPDGGSLKAFTAGGSSPRHDAVLRDAVADVLGLSLAVDAVLDPSRAPSGHSGAGRPPAGGPPPAPPAANETRLPRPRPDTAATAARAAAQVAGTDSPGPAAARTEARPGDLPNPDLDPDADDSGLSEEDLLARELGATVVERVSDG